MIKFSVIPDTFVRVYIHNRIKLVDQTPQDIQRSLVLLVALLGSTPSLELEKFAANFCRIERVDPSSMLQAVKHLVAIYDVLRREIPAQEIEWLKTDIEAVYDERVTSRHRINYS